jgi:hypothetical protein
MGFLSRLFGQKPSRTAEAMTLHASQLVEVVGESHRQGALTRVAASAGAAGPFLEDLSGRALKIAESELGKSWFRAVLVCEPGNKQDPNAVAVHADGVGLIGYLNRNDAIDYQPVFAALRARGCSAGSCPAFLIGGETGKPTFGVMLCLSSPEKIVIDLDATLPA